MFHFTITATAAAELDPALLIPHLVRQLGEEDPTMPAREAVAGGPTERGTDVRFLRMELAIPGRGAEFIPRL